MSKAEKFIQNYTRNCSNECWDAEGSYHPWLSIDETKKAVEIAREEELEYIKYQLELKLPETLDYNGVQVDRKDFINDFIKAMKEK